ncbi:MAG: DinB family protein, partial [Acidimicrobiia bacterium]|nr:DinB family protein [Acidimicrobiia bacterium]
MTVDLEELATTLESLPEVLSALLSPLDGSVLRRRPSDEEWCALEVIGHLIVVDEPAFRERIKRIVAGEVEVPEVDGAALAADEDFLACSLSELLDRLRDERSRSVSFIRSLSDTDLAVAAEHRTYGTLTAGDFTHEWPFHDQDHLQQILAAIK